MPHCTSSVVLVQLSGAWHPKGRIRTHQAILVSQSEAFVFGAALVRLGFRVRDSVILEGATCECHGEADLSPLPVPFAEDVPEHLRGMPLASWGQACALQAVRLYRLGVSCSAS
jgi:hypothetical protein